MWWTTWSRVSGSRRSWSLVCWFGHSCCLETLWTHRLPARHTPPDAAAHRAHTWHCTDTHIHNKHTQPRLKLLSLSPIKRTSYRISFFKCLPVAIPVPPNGGRSLCRHRDRWPVGAVIGRTAPLTSLSHLMNDTSQHAPSFPHRTHLSTEHRHTDTSVWLECTLKI